MLQTLLTLLKADAPAPEIMLEEGGDLGLDYYNGKLDISITPAGHTAWAVMGGRHGTDLTEFIGILENWKEV